MMQLRVVALAGLCAAMVTLPRPADAQLGGPRGQDTYFTFSQPVELPNVTLPAGSYLFQLVDTMSNRHIVRVMSRDRQKVFTTVMAIPSYSLNRPPEEPQIRFMETPAGAPNIVKMWLYPGNTTGHEFIYPRNQATRLARTSGEPVLTTKTDTDVSRGVEDSELSRVDRDGQDVDAAMSSQRESENARSQSGTTQAETPTTSPQTSSGTPPASTPATTPSADVSAQGASAASTGAGRAPATTEPQAPATRATAPSQTTAGPAGASTPAGRTTRTALPRTASQLPLLSLLGVIALALSALVRHARRA